MQYQYFINNLIKSLELKYKMQNSSQGLMGINGWLEFESWNVINVLEIQQ